jgi:hypothetical protein
MKRLIGPALALAVACLGGGCVSDLNYCAHCVNRWWTTDQAWRNREWMFEDIPCASSFEAGFKAGYRFANCGGDSCQPPGPSHFWSASGMTDQDRRDAQAWSDGFTHGTMAAQQDGNVVASALDAQTARPPEGVPDVYYYPNQGAFPNQGALSSIGSPQYEGQLAASPYYPNQFSGEQLSAGGQFGGVPIAQGQPIPGMMPVATQAQPVPEPMSASPRPVVAPATAAYPPSAPPSEALDLSIGSVGTPTTRYHGSAAFPGIGSLRSPIPANSPDVAPSALAPNPGANAVPPVANAPSTGTLPVSSPVATPTKGSVEAAPSTQPAPVIRSAPASQWEMPIIRD